MKIPSQNCDTEDIESSYSGIVDSLKTSSDQFIPKTKFSKHLKPFLNNVV